MKRSIAILTFVLGSAIAAQAAQPAGQPKPRVSAPHDHTPTIHSEAPQPHK